MIPRTARRANLERWIGNFLMLRLFVNNIDPDDECEAADFIEPQDGVYKPRRLDAGLWEYRDDGIEAEAFCERQAIALRGPTRVYGWLLTDETRRIVLAERFSDGPYKVQSGGGQVRVRPFLSNRRETVLEA